METNKELELAYQFVQFTNRHVFLTGKAGTGKTTFLRSLKTRISKRMVVVAPTGVAAINAGGVTVHSFFQLPFGPILTERVTGKRSENQSLATKFNKRKINIIKSLDLLVIDEISMVRADMLDAIDEVLRRYRNRFLPFGGLQLLMIGDLQQLAPVVKDEEWALLKSYYNSMYFFNSRALEGSPMITIELKKVFRQQDGVFLDILNQIRDNKLSQEMFNKLHERHIQNFKATEGQGYITLTTHNAAALEINEHHLENIKSKPRSFKATIKGIFPEYMYPTEYELVLKEGAQVMFIKNDPSYDKKFYNGKIGKVVDIDGEVVYVHCEGDDDAIVVEALTWENINYKLNPVTNDIEEEVVGSFVQHPLRLAWAITIHKSQGLTFERAIIDAQAAFAHGQTYVALSRCKTLEGLVLSSRISPNAIICDYEVSKFNNEVEKNQPDQNVLNLSKQSFQLELIADLFNYKQLSYRLQHLEKLIDDNFGSAHGTLAETLESVMKNVLPEVTGVATRFMVQVTELLKSHPDMETNQALQERMMKAAKYFYDYHANKIINPLKSSSFATDNKNFEKDVNDSLSLLNEVLKVKQALHESCFNGFKMADFQRARSIAAISPEEKGKYRKQEMAEVETKNPKLYKVLKYWRQAESEREDLPLNQVISQKGLKNIADNLPVNRKQLLSLSGIGATKVKKYGVEILSMVVEYMQEQGVDVELPQPEERKKSSHEISYELFKSGVPIEQIARDRNFAVSTIEGHLARYVALGELDIKELVVDDDFKMIKSELQKNPEILFGDLKNVLPEHIGYGQLRMVQAYLKYMEEMEGVD